MATAPTLKKTPEKMVENNVYSTPVKADVAEGTIESQHVDTAAEKRVLRKVDRHIVPVCLLVQYWEIYPLTVRGY